MDYFNAHLNNAPDTKEQIKFHLNATDYTALFNTTNKLEARINKETRQKLSAWYPLQNVTRFFNYLHELCDILQDEKSREFVTTANDNFIDAINKHHKELQLIAKEEAKYA